MTIEQLKARKKQLEQEIREAVTKSVQEFIQGTGISPEPIEHAYSARRYKRGVTRH